MCPHRLDLAAGIGNELPQSVDRLHLSESRRVGRAHVQNCVVRKWRELPQRRLVVGASLVQGHLFALADVDAHDRTLRSPAQAVRYSRGTIVREAPPVEDGAVGYQSEHPFPLIAGLRQSRDGPNLDKPKPESPETFEPGPVAVHTCGQAQRTWKVFSEGPNAQAGVVGTEDASQEASRTGDRRDRSERESGDRMGSFAVDARKDHEPKDELVHQHGLWRGID